MCYAIIPLMVIMVNLHLDRNTRLQYSITLELNICRDRLWSFYCDKHFQDINVFFSVIYFYDFTYLITNVFIYGKSIQLLYLYEKHVFCHSKHNYYSFSLHHIHHCILWLNVGKTIIIENRIKEREREREKREREKEMIHM